LDRRLILNNFIKALPIGTEKEFTDGKYKKVAEGKWKKIKEIELKQFKLKSENLQVLEQSAAFGSLSEKKYFYKNPSKYILDKGKCNESQPLTEEEYKDLNKEVKIIKPQPKACYENSQKLAANSGGKYKLIEGYLFLPEIPLNIPHSWNETTDGKLIDITIQNNKNCQYIGVEIPTMIMYQNQLNTKVYGACLVEYPYTLIEKGGDSLEKAEMVEYCDMILVDENDKILLLKRNNLSEMFPGLWGLCGGHKEKNETPIEGAKRECLEESGIEVKNCSFFEVKKIPNGIIHFYISKNTNEEQQFNLKELYLVEQEHSNYYWASKTQLKKMDLIPGLLDTLIKVF
jgi:8-oxo-dGTP pyrophosphatase MutT (NUDIX family)